MTYASLGIVNRFCDQITCTSSANVRKISYSNTANAATSRIFSHFVIENNVVCNSLDKYRATSTRWSIVGPSSQPEPAWVVFITVCCLRGWAISCGKSRPKHKLRFTAHLMSVCCLHEPSDEQPARRANRRLYLMADAQMDISSTRITLTPKYRTDMLLSKKMAVLRTAIQQLYEFVTVRSCFTVSLRI